MTNLQNAIIKMFTSITMQILIYCCIQTKKLGMGKRKPQRLLQQSARLLFPLLQLLPCLAAQGGM